MGIKITKSKTADCYFLYMDLSKYKVGDSVFYNKRTKTFFEGYEDDDDVHFLGIVIDQERLICSENCLKKIVE